MIKINEIKKIEPHIKEYFNKKQKCFLDPIYETLFSGHTGRPIRSIGTQIDKVTTKLKTFWLFRNFWAF